MAVGLDRLPRAPRRRGTLSFGVLRLPRPRGAARSRCALLAWASGGIERRFGRGRRALHVACQPLSAQLLWEPGGRTAEGEQTRRRAGKPVACLGACRGSDEDDSTSPAASTLALLGPPGRHG